MTTPQAWASWPAHPAEMDGVEVIDNGERESRPLMARWFGLPQDFTETEPIWTVEQTESDSIRDVLSERSLMRAEKAL